MFSPDVRVEDFDVEDWLALGRLFQKRREVGASRGGLVALTEGGRVVKLLSTETGRLDPPDGEATLAELVQAHGARWAVRADRGALEDMADRFAEGISRGDDVTAQTLVLLGVLRDLSLEGRLEAYPRDFSGWPVPHDAAVGRALDVVCPSGKTILFGVFEGGSVETAVALHRGRRGFDRVVGPSEVRRELGLVSDDWARNYRGLARAVELGVGPLALGLFAQKRTWSHLFSSSTPGRWSAALASREVILHPLAPAVAIPIGVDLGRVAFSVARGLAGRLGVSSRHAITGALGRLRETAAAHPELPRFLGFDPVAVLSELLGGPRGNEPEGRR